MSAPRVAVVGGGIAGSLAALGLAARGVVPVVFDCGVTGGRLGGSSRWPLEDDGAQFLRASSEGGRFGRVLHLLEQRGVVARWRGEFGLLGSRGGGFLPQSAVPASRRSASFEEEAVPSLVDSDDFCGLIDGEGGDLFVGTPANSAVCAGIQALVGESLVARPRWRVVETELGRDDGRWRVRSVDARGSDVEEQFEAVLFATHDPTLAASALASTISGVGDGAVAERLAALERGLARVAGHRAPVWTLSAHLARGTRRAPFDAVTVPGSALLRFLSRDASKPERKDDATLPTELWTCVSTSAFAERVTDAAQAEELLLKELARLLAPFFFFENDTREEPRARGSANVKRWSAAFADADLSDWSRSTDERAILLEPFNLAIAGDFVRKAATPLEAAALSGLEAGERLGALLAAR